MKIKSQNSTPKTPSFEPPVRKYTRPLLADSTQKPTMASQIMGSLEREVAQQQETLRSLIPPPPREPKIRPKKSVWSRFKHTFVPPSSQRLKDIKRSEKQVQDAIKKANADAKKAKKANKANKTQKPNLRANGAMMKLSGEHTNDMYTTDDSIPARNRCCEQENDVQMLEYRSFGLERSPRRTASPETMRSPSLQSDDEASFDEDPFADPIITANSMPHMDWTVDQCCIWVLCYVGQFYNCCIVEKQVISYTMKLVMAKMGVGDRLAGELLFEIRREKWDDIVAVIYFYNARPRCNVNIAEKIYNILLRIQKSLELLEEAGVEDLSTRLVIHLKALRETKPDF